MKVRTGFVSNSSSSSFVLDKCGMTDEQVSGLNKWLKKVSNEEDDNCITETTKHFFGRISYHNNPSIIEIMDILGIDKTLFEEGD